MIVWQLYYKNLCFRHLYLMEEVDSSYVKAPVAPTNIVLLPLDAEQ